MRITQWGYVDFLFWLSCWHRLLMHSPENNPACCAAYRARSFGTMSPNTPPLSRSRGLAARAQQKQRSSPPAAVLRARPYSRHKTRRTACRTKAVVALGEVMLDEPGGMRDAKETRRNLCRLSGEDGRIIVRGHRRVRGTGRT